MWKLIRSRYGVKLALGYATTGAFVASVGFLTGSVAATVIATVSGLLALGSITGTATLSAAQEIEREAQRIADGDLDREVHTQRTDELGRIYQAVDGMRVSLSERISEIEDARQEAERTSDEATRMADDYQRIAEQYAGTMQRAAEGDLTQRIDTDTEYESMTTIGREFNTTMEQLQEALADVGVFASNIREDVDEMRTRGAAVEDAVDGAVDTAEDITDRAQSQRAQIETVTQDVDTLSATAEEVAATVDDLAERSDDVTETSADARTAASDAIDEMEQIQTEVDDAVEQIEALADSTDEITEIVDIIGDIAEQTNMLALNASIEAARAGDGGGSSGNGFAVVADEVKQLAGKTQTRADEIGSMIEEVRDATGEQTTKRSEQLRSCQRCGREQGLVG